MIGSRLVYDPKAAVCIVAANDSYVRILWKNNVLQAQKVTA